MTNDRTISVLFVAEANSFTLIRKSTQALESPIQRGPENSSQDIKLRRRKLTNQLHTLLARISAWCGISKHWENFIFLDNTILSMIPHNKLGQNSGTVSTAIWSDAASSFGTSRRHHHTFVTSNNKTNCRVNRLYENGDKRNYNRDKVTHEGIYGE